MAERECVIFISVTLAGERYRFGYACDQYGIRREIHMSVTVVQGVAQIVDTAYAFAAGADPEQRQSLLRDCGERLYQLLDGGDRIIAGLRAATSAAGQRLIVAIDVASGLTNLPWELMHDGTGYLVNAAQPVIPVRWLPVAVEVAPRPPAARPFRLLFMACAPTDDNLPTLDYDGEHDEIVRLAVDYKLQPDIDDSGDLQSLRDRLGNSGEEHFDAVHLMGHAMHTPAGPVFIAEGLEGERVDADKTALLGALSISELPLIFLSGCRTAEASDIYATAALAQSLAAEAAPVVLGWGRPVGDRAATRAARAFYEVLAQGRTLALALTRTYQAMAGQNDPYWHTLRTFVRGRMPGAFVTAASEYPNDVVLRSARLSHRLSAEWTGFIGRRRELQDAMRRLRETAPVSPVGVMYHGPGGIGKTWLADRIVRRLGDRYDVVKVCFGLSWRKLEDAVKESRDRELRQAMTSAVEWGRATTRVSPADILTDFLARYGERPDARPLLFYLDEFESAFERDSSEEGDLRRVDGLPVTDPDAATTLDALIAAIIRCDTGPHRILMTTRYPPNLESVRQHLPAEELAAFGETDAERLVQRGVDDGYERRAPAHHRKALDTAKDLAAGNPQLLAYLVGQVVENGRLDQDRMQTLLRDARGEFLNADIFIRALLGTLSAAEHHLLSAIAPFRRPVPVPVIARVASVDRVEAARTAGRLASMSLMQRVAGTGGRPEYLVFGMFEAVLASAEPESDRDRYRRCARAFAEELGEVWDVPNERALDRGALRELRRLAERADETALLLDTVAALANCEASWLDFAAAAAVCNSGLAGRQGTHRLYFVLAQATAELGARYDPRLYFDRAMELCPADADAERADILASRGFWTGTRLTGSALPDLDAAIEVARAHDRPGTLAFALRTKARALTDRYDGPADPAGAETRRATAARLVAEAEALVRDDPDRIIEYARVLLDRAIAVHLTANEFDAAATDLRTALDIMEAYGTSLDQAIILQTQASALVSAALLQDWDKPDEYKIAMQLLARAERHTADAVLRSSVLRVAAGGASLHGDIADARGQFELALLAYRSAADLAHVSGNLSAEMYALTNIVDIAQECGYVIPFAAIQERRYAVSQQLGDPAVRVRVLIDSLTNGRDTGEIDAVTAVVRGQQVAALAVTAGLPESELEALKLVTDYADDAGVPATQLEAPLRRLVELLNGRRDSRLASASARLGTLMLQMNRPAEAQAPLREALRQYDQFGIQEPAAQASERLAEAARTLGQLDDAAKHLRDAARRRIRVLRLGAAAQTLRTLASVVQDRKPGRAWSLLCAGRRLARLAPSGLDEADLLEALADQVAAGTAPDTAPTIEELRQAAQRARRRARPVQVELGSTLRMIADPAHGGPFVEGISALRAGIEAEAAFRLPPVHVSSDPGLGPDDYAVWVWGDAVAEGTAAGPDPAPHDVVLSELRRAALTHEGRLYSSEPAPPTDADTDRRSLAEILAELTEPEDGSDG